MLSNTIFGQALDEEAKMSIDRNTHWPTASVAPPKRKPHRRLQDWEKQAIVDAYIAGEPSDSVAAEFNTTPSTIRHLAARRGLPPRKLQSRAIPGNPKTYPMYMRTTKDMRDKIVASAKANGRSMVHEVEHRIAWSFRQELA